MSSELFEIIVPSIAFFFAFFLAFTLMEMMVVLLLNGFVFKHWGFVVDVVMRVKVRHGTLMRFATLLLMTVFIGVLLKYTAVLRILDSATLEEKLYAGQTFLVILLTYRLATGHLMELTFLKQIHRYLFIYLSVVVYVLMILLVNSQYDNYQRLINATVVHPIGENVKVVMENYQRKKILNEMRRLVHNDRCPRVDYMLDLTKGLTKHFIYVTTDPDLATLQEVLSDAPKNYTIGRACTYANETFLLTDYGQWFWVIDAT
ncbi:hypothetical protein KKA33_02675 [Patescibacteria group bacterium]|nr:hypothetical protein [Patescibacteria group bacterium]